MEIIDIFKEYVYPELLVLIPVLLIVGKMMKTSETILDKNIPWTLGIIGIALSTLYVISNITEVTISTVTSAVFVSIVQGILVAGGAVYFNQLNKQANKDE